MEFPTYIAILNYLTDGSYPMDCDKKNKKKIRNMAEGLVIDQGKLFTEEDDNDKLGLEILHEGNIHEIIIRIHGEGHLGIRQTIHRLKLKYTADNLEKHVKMVLQSCDVCQFRAKVLRKRYEPSRPISIPKYPFTMIGCDAVGPVLPSKAGNKYILVAVDYLTKWPIAEAVPNINERTTQKFLYNKIIVNYGVPNYILTDRGSNFTSTFVNNFLSSIGCKHITTTAYRPQTNGLCERLNQTLVQVLSKLISDKGVDISWDEYLEETLFAIRTMINDTTGYSPARLLFGYELISPGIWSSPREDFVEGELIEEIVERIKLIKSKIIETQVLAKLRSDKKQKKNKIAYDKQVGERPSFRIGEQVLMKDVTPANKFSDKWIGPMLVIRVNQKGTYYLQGPNGKRLNGAVNGDMLKPYYSRRFMIPEVVKASCDKYEVWLERWANKSL